MRNLKKVLSLALALVMLLGMMIVGAGAVDTGFKDDASIKDDFKTAAAITKALGIMTGDGTNLNPNANIVRAEAFILSLRVDGSNANAIAAKWPVSEKPFNDVTTGKWYAPYLTYGKEMGLISGNNGNYNPDGKITVVEYSILLLKQLGFDGSRYTGAKWNVNAASDAQAVGLYEGLGNINYYNHELTRQEACQMALNALLYSPEGEKNVYTVKNPEGVVLPGFTERTFNSAADAYFYQQSQGKDTVDNGEIDTYPVVEITTTYPGSLGDKAFGLTKTDNAKDDFGRPATEYTADKYNLDLVIPNTVTYTYNGPVSNKTVRSAVGSGALRYTWTESVDGHTATALAVPANDGNGFASSARGTVTEIYVDSDAKTVKVVSVNTYVGEVTRVTPAKGENDRYVTVTGGKTFATESFAKDDVVLYTIAGAAAGQEAIQTMQLAEEVSGEFTRKVVASGADDAATWAKHTYTVGGTVYHWSKQATATDLNQIRIGNDITLYLDTQGNIVKIGDVAAQAAKYIYILANPTAKENPDYITGVKDVVEVYGVLADGTVGKYTVKSVVNTLNINIDGDVDTDDEGEPKAVQCVVTSAPGVVAGQKTGGTGTDDNPYTYEKYVEKTDLADRAYSYTVDGNGYLTLTAEVTSRNDAPIQKNTRRDNDAGVLNSSTVFVFIDTVGGENKTVKGVEVKTGVANIGVGVGVDTVTADNGVGTTNTTIGHGLVAKNSSNVAKVVFVPYAFDAGTGDTGTLVYVTNVKRVQTTTSGTTYVVSGIDEDGNEINDAGWTGAPESAPAAEDVWTLDNEGDLKTRKPNTVRDIYEVNGNNVRYSTDDDNDRLFQDEEITKVVDLSDNGLKELGKGQRAILVGGTGGKAGYIVVAFIIEEPNDVITMPSGSNVQRPAADKDTLAKYFGENDENYKEDTTEIKAIVSVEPNTSFKLPSGAFEQGKATIINGKVIKDWGNPEITTGFTFSIDKNEDAGKVFQFTVKDASGTTKITKTAVCSGDYDMGIFYNDPTSDGDDPGSDPALTPGDYFWTIELYANGGKGNPTGTGTEVAHGNFSISD